MTEVYNGGHEIFIDLHDDNNNPTHRFLYPDPEDFPFFRDLS